MLLPILAVALVVADSRTRDVVLQAPEALSILYFAAGTTQIRPRDNATLDAHARWLKGERKRVLVIEGHSDEPGDSTFGREVGEHRAKSAKAYLVSKGATADRIMVVSRGGGRPVCAEKTATCRAANRRVTFSTGVLP